MRAFTITDRFRLTRTPQVYDLLVRVGPVVLNMMYRRRGVAPGSVKVTRTQEQPGD